MWSSRIRSLAVTVACAGCTSNPDVVIDVTNDSSAQMSIVVCQLGGRLTDPAPICKPHTLVASEHSVGIFSSAAMLTVLFDVEGAYCQRLDLDLATTPVDISFTAGPTVALALLGQCDPMTACPAGLVGCQ